MKIAVVILNYNGYQDTLECLTSLYKIKRSTFETEIIIVDNASTDTSVSEIKKQIPKVALITNQKNLGFAEGNNAGIRVALSHDADFILILNNDTEVHKDLFEKLIEAAQIEQKGGIFGPKIYFSKGSETHGDKYKPSDLGHVIWYAGGKMDWDNVLGSHRGVDEVDAGQYDEMTKTGFVSGCAMFIRREVFEKVGFMDPKFFLYYEDVDFCERARKKGYELFYVPDGIVWHKNATSGGGTGSELQSYYITRNRLLIGIRYAPWKTKLALHREALKLLMQGTRTQRQAVGDFLRKKYGPRQKMWEWKKPNINILRIFKWERLKVRKNEKENKR